MDWKRMPCGQMYCVWWIGGWLRPKERKQWVRWGALLKEAFYDENLDHPFVNPGYHFHWKSRCTEEAFFDIWQSPNTAAIIWCSHGHSGWPIPYDWRFENRDPTDKEAIQWRFNADEPFFPKASPSLRALALVCCDSNMHTKSWAKKLHQKAALKTFSGILQPSPSSWAKVTVWMRSNFKSRSGMSLSSDYGARYLLRNLRWNGPFKWPDNLASIVTKSNLRSALAHKWRKRGPQGFQQVDAPGESRGVHGPVGIS